MLLECCLYHSFLFIRYFVLENEYGKNKSSDILMFGSLFEGSMDLYLVHRILSL